MPWTLPVLLLFKRRNRTLRAALALAPALVIQSAGWIVMWAFEAGFGDAGFSFALDLLTGLVAGVTSVWLLAGGSQAGGWGAVLPRSALVLAIAALLGAIGVTGGDLSGESFGYLVAYMFLVVTLLAGVAVGAVRQKRAPSLRRFLTGLLLGALVGPAALGTAAGVGLGVLVAVVTGEPAAILGLPVAMVFIGFAAGLVNCVLLLVFAVFTRYSKEYSRRWRSELFPVIEETPPLAIPVASAGAP